ncbi:uncharacterized protein V6R79_015513 [Siganus canaliculatus]
MFASVASSCARSGRKVSVPVAQLTLFSARTRTQTRTRTLVPDRLPGLLSAPPRLLFSGLRVRFVSGSSGGPDPRGSLSAPDPPDRDGFGSLSTDVSSRRSFRKVSPDLRDLLDQQEEQQEEVQPGRRPGRRNTPYWFFLQCKRLIRDNQLQEALQLFRCQMLQEEKLQPEEFNYSVLIGGCGRAGLLGTAFRLYNDMKKRGLEPSDATITALFNACAEAPSRRAGLQGALKLEQELRRRNRRLSAVTYHALLKAHAVTNHLQACVHLLREMLQSGHAVTPETFQHLLMGCVREREAGFRMALQVWRQMLSSGIVPDAKNYNLLLRIARDCGIGDPALAAGVLLRRGRKWERGAAVDVDLLEQQLFLQPGRHGDGDGETGLVPAGRDVSLPADSPGVPVAPNLLRPFEGASGGVIALGAVNTACDRLALIGGAEGFLENMEAGGLSPDLRTLTLLADTMETGRSSLPLLLAAAKRHGVKLDAAFFNTAIRRAARAGDQEAAQAVLAVMRQRHVSVDLQTFGCLALGCERQQDAVQLLRDMEEAGLKPNVHVFSALIGRASRRLDYAYLKTVLKSMSSLGVWPNEVIIRQLEFAAQYPPNYNQYKSRNNYLVQIDGFRGYYQQWLRDMPAQSGEDEQAELQPQPDATATTPDRLTASERNQRAAARRFNSQKKKKKNGGGA